MKKIIVAICLFYIGIGIMQAQRIVFTPQWTPQSQFAGYYVAHVKGFYKDAGVEVDFQHSSASYSALNRLMEGSSDMITQRLSRAVMAIDKGIPMVHVLQTFQQSALVLVGRSDSIRTIKDLKNKKVGIWKVDNNDLALIMDAEYDLNINWIPFVEGINLFISGAIDVTFAMSYNEYLKIKVSGHEDKPVIRLAETEYSYPDDGLYVNADFYQRYPEKVQAFVEASKKGWEWAHQHPDETLDIILKWMERENIPTNRIHERFALEEILRLQCKSGENKPSYQLDAEIVKKLSDLFLKHRLIQHPISVEKLKGGQP